MLIQVNLRRRISCEKGAGLHQRSGPRRAKMTGKTTNSFEAFQFPQSLFDGTQKFMPNNRVFEQLNEVARTLAEAQMAYGQALMRANATLLSAMFTQAAPAAEGERPSEAALKSGNTSA
jgi:hypothetical protein